MDNNTRTCLVARERSSSDRLAEMIFLFLAIAFCITAVLVNSWFFIGAIPCILLWYLRMKHYHIEFEYQLSGDMLKIVRITNKKARADMGEYDLTSILGAADTTDSRLDPLRKNRPRYLDLSSHSEKARDLSLFLTDKNNRLTELQFSPDETMKKLILRKVPAKARKLS